jgi:hypothetical protein
MKDKDIKNTKGKTRWYALTGILFIMALLVTSCSNQNSEWQSKMQSQLDTILSRQDVLQNEISNQAQVQNQANAQAQSSAQALATAQQQLAQAQTQIQSNSQSQVQYQSANNIPSVLDQWRILALRQGLITPVPIQPQVIYVPSSQPQNYRMNNHQSGQYYQQYSNTPWIQRSDDRSHNNYRGR